MNSGFLTGSCKLVYLFVKFFLGFLLNYIQVTINTIKTTFLFKFWFLASFQAAWIYIIMETMRTCQLTTSLCSLARRKVSLLVNFHLKRFVRNQDYFMISQCWRGTVVNQWCHFKKWKVSLNIYNILYLNIHLNIFIYCHSIFHAHEDKMTRYVIMRKPIKTGIKSQNNIKHRFTGD